MSNIKILPVLPFALTTRAGIEDQDSKYASRATEYPLTRQNNTGSQSSSLYLEAPCSFSHV